MDNQFILAGDIGGTKTILALFSQTEGPLHPQFESTFASGAYDNLDTIIT